MDTAESTDALHLALVGNLDVRGLQLFSHRVEISHAKVHHEGPIGVEIVCVSIEGREYRDAGLRHPGSHLHVRWGRVDAKVVPIPFSESFGVLGPKEEPAESLNCLQGMPSSAPMQFYQQLGIAWRPPGITVMTPKRRCLYWSLRHWSDRDAWASQKASAYPG